MATVNVVTIAAYRRIYWLRLIDLVQRSAATWCWCCNRQMNPVNSRTGSALAITIAECSESFCWVIVRWSTADADISADSGQLQRRRGGAVAQVPADVPSQVLAFS